MAAWPSSWRGAVLAEGGPVDAVGHHQPAGVHDRVGPRHRRAGRPGLGWQDLRTVGTCLVLQADGIRVAPNASATKVGYLLDDADPDRTRDLCVGTVDTWLAWHLSEGARARHRRHQRRASPACSRGDGTRLGRQGPRRAAHPARRAAARSSTAPGIVGQATALDGAPPIAALVGDQQSSLVGQGGVRPGLAKITFGTGGMLDLHLGEERPRFERQGEGGCFPIVAWRRGGDDRLGRRGGDAVGRHQRRVAPRRPRASSPPRPRATRSPAGARRTDGVVYVPALLGLGTPRWDYGARGTLLGLTRGSERPQIVRAVLEGVAQRGADLVEAAEADTGLTIPSLRVDGGMTDNPTFVQALADATQRPVEVSPVKEATTLGAAFLAGLAVGTWAGWDDIAATWRPKHVVEPGGTARPRALEARAATGPPAGSPSCRRCRSERP